MGTLINDKDLCFALSFAQEVNRLAGTECRYYQFEPAKSIRDPLYGEPIRTEYKEDPDGNLGIEMNVFFKAPDKSAITGEEGRRIDRISEAEFAKKDFTDNDLKEPRNGDIIKIWKTFWDVTIDHKDQSQLSDSGTGETMYKVDLVRRSKGPAESLWLRDKE